MFLFIYCSWNDPPARTDITVWNQTFSLHNCDYIFFQLSPPSSLWVLCPPPPPLYVMCRNQSIVHLALLDSFSSLLLGVLSVEIDSLGLGLAPLRNVRVSAEQAALLANSSSSSDIDPRAFSSLAPNRWHRNGSTSKERYETKRHNSLLTRLLTNTQLVWLAQYVHHPRRMSCCPGVTSDNIRMSEPQMVSFMNHALGSCRWTTQYLFTIYEMS